MSRLSQSENRSVITQIEQHVCNVCVVFWEDLPGFSIQLHEQDVCLFYPAIEAIDPGQVKAGINRFSVGASAFRALGAFSVSGGVDLATERPERWGGEVLQDGNLGRTDVLAGIKATYQIGRYGLGLGVKVPVYQHIVTGGDEGGQLSYPAILEFSVERGFDLRKE